MLKRSNIFYSFRSGAFFWSTPFSAPRGMRHYQYKTRCIMRIHMLLLPCVIFAAAACASMNSSLLNKKPEATIEKVSIDTISFRDITLLFNIAVRNPYPVNIHLDGVRFKLNIEKNRLFETESKKAVRISPNSNEISQFLVNIQFSDLQKIVKNYIERDYLECEAAGEIIVRLPKTGIQGFPETYSFPYSIQRKIPAVKPEITISRFTVEKPSPADITDALRSTGKSIDPQSVSAMFGDILSGKKSASRELNPKDIDIPITVSFVVELANRAKSKISFDSVSYQLFLNSDTFITGSTSDIRNAGDKSYITVKNRFSSKLLSGGITQFFNDRRGSFALKGHASIRLPEQVQKEPLKFIFDEKGTLSL